MIEDLLIILIVVIIVFVLIRSIHVNFYKKCPAGSIMVIFNSHADAYGSNIKFVKSGGAFIWPFGASYAILDLSPFSIAPNPEKLTDKLGNTYQIDLKMLLALSSNENILQNAIERISGLSKEQLNNIANDLISANLRSFFAGIAENEIKDKESFKEKLNNCLDDPLEKIGLKILNLDIIEVKQGS